MYLAIQASGETKVALARRLKIYEKEMRRLLDPRHATKVARIQEVLAALGKRLVAAVEDAA